MKITKLIILTLVLIYSNISFGQIKTRETAQWYAGAGYTFVIFNDSRMTDSYPLFSKSGEFLKEINFFGGVKLNKSLSVEFSPSFMFSNAATEKGFNYTNATGTQRFYVPTQTNFLSIPLNIKAKYYPFTLDLLSFASNLYIGVEAGTVYIKEDVTNYIYTDNTMMSFVGTQKSENSMWKPDFGISIGYGTTGKFGYGFEAAYRIIPLDADNKFPLSTSTAKNMNSINLSLKIIFGL